MLNHNHLISITDFDAKRVRAILALAHQVKKYPAQYRNKLQGKMFGLIFEKPSTRTWISFESGIFGMGGGVIYLGPEDIKLGIREEVKDVARVLNRYLAGMVLRTFSHQTINEFKKYFEGPIINGLSDVEHPCQALADFMTIEEQFGKKAKPVIAFIGDGNNVLNSLILLGALLGIDIHYATPKNHEPNLAVLEQAKALARKSGSKIAGTNDPLEAVRGVDVIYTDVWVSMGEESLRDQKMKAFKGMQVNEALLKHAKKNVRVMHCLPAHRGEEITDGVMESKHSMVFDQAENRLHVQKAVLLHLLQS
ncbi:MAG: ornithine carbamoyltransferase [Candidatus Omnitrophica bacterium]|nr:ornithine carbamoyltransferase [Candidatus Omnitrophota bacterium]